MTQGTKGQKSNAYARYALRVRIRIYDLGGLRFAPVVAEQAPPALSNRNNMRKEQIWLFFSQIVRIPNGVMDCGISEIGNL